MKLVKVDIRLVNLDIDLEILYYWRQNPLVFNYFKLQSAPLKWDNHIEFWENYNNRIDWIVLFEGRKVGSVYFKINDENELDIGIYIADVTLRGKGLGSHAISYAIEWARVNQFKLITALIHNENLASIKLFEKHKFNFLRLSKHNGFLDYQLQINNEE